MGRPRTSPPPPPDTTTTFFNPPPVVTILMPEDGQLFSSAVPMEATVSDDIDAAFTLTWSSPGLDEPIVGQGPTYFEVGNFDPGCPAVEHVITATVIDSGGAVGTDTTTVRVGCP